MLVNPDSTIHGANMGLTWVLSAPGGSHVNPMNFAIREGVPGHRHSACAVDIRYPGYVINVASDVLVPNDARP